MRYRMNFQFLYFTTWTFLNVRIYHLIHFAVKTCHLYGYFRQLTLWNCLGSNWLQNNTKSIWRQNWGFVQPQFNNSLHKSMNKLRQTIQALVNLQKKKKSWKLTINEKLDFCIIFPSILQPPLHKSNRNQLLYFSSRHDSNATVKKKKKKTFCLLTNWFQLILGKWIDKNNPPREHGGRFQQLRKFKW